MDVAETLEELHKKAMREGKLRRRLLDTRNHANPLSEFCEISTAEGLPLSVMDLIEYGEASYAAMRRSTNGGGENSPLLHYEDDAYELFLSSLSD